MIDKAGKSSRRLRQIAFSLGAGFLLTSAFVCSAQAAGYQNLAVVKPVMSCGQLAQADLSKISDARITLQSATVRETEKGPYCSVMGAIEPGMGFRADLPIERWTQRYLQNAQGRYTDFTERAGGCAPGGFTNEYGRPMIGSLWPGGAGKARRPNCPATNFTSGAVTCSEKRLCVQ